MTGIAEGSLAPAPWYDAKRIVQFVAFVSAAVAALAALLLPTYSVVIQSSDGPAVESARTLLEVNGAGALIVVLVPVLLAGLPLPLRGSARRPVSIGCAVLLVGFVVISSASIGIFFLMTAICAVAAVFIPPRIIRRM